MNLSVIIFDIVSGKRSVIINEIDADSIGVLLNDRVKITYNNKTVVAIVETSRTLVPEGKIAFYRDVSDTLGVRQGDIVEMNYEPLPKSVVYIRKKMAGEKLTESEIRSIVVDVVSSDLSDLEIASFLLASYYKGMDLDEVKALTTSMVDTGDKLSLEGHIVDKHSIGGVPGNKVSLLIVPIIASTELLIPKSSSKAITSPSGTADTMAVFANVKFSLNEIKNIVTKTHGCIVWGGALNLAPADDLLIRIENPLKIDPKGQMLASIMSKKLAAGAKTMVLDIPVGRGTKVNDLMEGEKLGNEFIDLGRSLGINVRVGITYGGQPVGRAIGPALEAREGLQSLIEPANASMSLVSKSTALAGILLEATGVAGRGQGSTAAMQLLTSGKALQKFRDIIEAQGGNPKIKPDDIPVGDHTYKLTADADGYITLVDNTSIADIARAAGAPYDKGAGLVIYQKQGYKVKAGDVLIKIFAERTTRLTEAIALANSRPPVMIEGMLLKSYPDLGGSESGPS